MPDSSKKSGGGKKYGRNKPKCQKYAMTHPATTRRPPGRNRGQSKVTPADRTRDRFQMPGELKSRLHRPLKDRSHIIVELEQETTQTANYYEDVVKVETQLARNLTTRAVRILARRPHRTVSETPAS